MRALQSLLHNIVSRKASMRDATQRYDRLMREYESLEPEPESGDFDEQTSIMLANHERFVRRNELRVELARLACQKGFDKDSIKESAFYTGLILPYVPADQADRMLKDAVQRSRGDAEQPQKPPQLEQRLIAEESSDGYVSDITRFITYRNSHSRQGMDSVVRGAGIGWIEDAPIGYTVLRCAMRKGHRVERFDRQLADDTMLDEMLRRYCTDYSANLKSIAQELSDRYRLNVSAGTISRYARKRLGHVRRRDRSAERAYLQSTSSR
jgi:hypothetical protein